MKWIGKPIVRKDALGKVTGETKYMTDLYFPDMLYGVIVRAGVPQELAGMALRRNIEIRSHGYFDMPSADKGIEGAYGLPHILYGSMTCVALVEVDTITGQVNVLKVVSAPDAGRIINRQGLEGQVEGGVVMGLGYALMEKVIFNTGRIINDNLDTYLMPTALDCPEIVVTPVEVIEKSGPFGAKGIGECTTGPIAPAILNAIYDAVGVRIRDLPVSMEKIFFALQNGTGIYRKGMRSHTANSE